jgi:C-methyltransferase
MQILIATRGCERTEAEWRSLLERGGFKLQEIVALRTFARLLVIKVC